MADLLECVIQIKALCEAIDTAMGGRSTSGLMSAEMQGVSVWQRMADAERRYAEALGTTIAGGAAPAPPDAGPAAEVEEFVAMRRANLAKLDRCTGAELAGFVEWFGRPSTKVADLVAIMLANDTEVLGELRRAWPQPEPRRPS
jgi:hypothetical protein